jgi:hypothetical protein
VAENPKYPPLELTDEDKKQLDGVIIKYAVEFRSLQNRYPNPKSYVENVVLKRLHSNDNVGVLLSMAYSKIDPRDALYRPTQLNQRLANDTRYTDRLHPNISTVSEDCGISADSFLGPRDLRERVLKKAEDLNIFVHIEGKKNIDACERNIRKKRTKAPPNENIEDRGGYPSAYASSDEIIRIRNIAEKAGGADYIREKMNGYGLGLELTKYLMEVFFYAAKMDKQMLPMMIGVGARFMNNHLAKSDIDQLEMAFQRLQSCTDNELQTFADYAAKFLTQHQRYHELLIFLSMLSKHWDI